jgi:vancomycin aglycone glucosyltransferase
MRVLLAPHGTRGDVQPMLALAVTLRDRGHTASFVAPSNFLDWIRSNGFEAVSDGIDVEAMLRSAGADLHSLRWQMAYLNELTAHLFESVARASNRCDVIVGAGVQMAASSVAEWRGVPAAAVAFCACGVPAGGSPPPNIRTQTLPAWLNRLLWQVSGPLADLALRRAINRGRATLRLDPISNPLSHLFFRCLIVAADRDLSPVGDDAPEGVVATDAWILNEPADLDPRVAAFLDLDPAPIYIGFGSMLARRIPDLAARAIAATRALGRAAIVAGGWAGLDRHIASAGDILTVDAVPHLAVFPRVAAVVHHGGAGTTTAAAAAGAPQVILPHILDQFYWAHRVERLGLGPRALPVDLITADILADRLDAALHDPGIRTRAAALGPAIAARNGTAAAVDHIERLVATHAPSA